MKSKLGTVLALALMIVFLGTGPASAASDHGWTTVASDYWHCCGSAGASHHGQYWDSSMNQAKAHHTKSSYWLGVQTRFTAYGVTYVSDVEWGSGIASIHQGIIHAHNPWI